jgi:hypothetical protein
MFIWYVPGAIGNLTLHHPSLSRVNRTGCQLVKSAFSSTLLADGASMRNVR